MVTVCLVTAAATLLESAPFVLAGVLLARPALRWSAGLVPYLGCGCGSGPSARSLPAAAATWLLFGPFVALTRLAAAILADRLRKEKACPHRAESLLAQLEPLAPLALLGGAFAWFAPAVGGTDIAPALQFFAGAFAAFAISPCALGGVALAAMLRGCIPAAAAGFLAVAGIADLRAIMRAHHRSSNHDSLGYAVMGAACAIVAARNGAGLLHPHFTPALCCCAVACAVLAYRHRGQSFAKLRFAPAIMLAGAVLGAPTPQYHATETTLSDAFAGERVDFTGIVTRTGPVTTLVRYAITCCRADAAPIAVRLARAPSTLQGWARASGVLVQDARGLSLQTRTLQPVAAPADPFVYR